MLRKIALAALLFTLHCIGALAGDLNGKWKADFETQAGPQKYIFEFHVDGTTLTGKINSDHHGETELREGKVNGDTIRFIELVTANGQEIKVTYTGKLDGDEIHFSRAFGSYHTEQIAAKRIKEPHPPGS